jgi:hypothetical protein
MLRLCHRRTIACKPCGLPVPVRAASKRLASDSNTTCASQKNPKTPADNGKKSTNTEKPKKTMAELDEEMKRAMEGLAGDGGESGVELEDGKPVAMKRGVRENMFRYI